MNPIILYENLFAEGTLTATSTSSGTGYDVDNLIDERSYTLWKASSNVTQNIDVDLGANDSADTIAIFNHNLYTIGASVNAQYFNGTAWVTALSSFTPTSDKAIMKTFTSVTGSKFRIQITGAGSAPEIAVAMIGARIEFEYAPETPFTPKDEGIKADTVEGETGFLLGADVRFNDITTPVTFKKFSRSWLETYFEPFWNNHGKLLRPFMFAWDLTNNPSDVLFARFDKSMRYRAPLSLRDYVDELTLQLKATAE